MLASAPHPYHVKMKGHACDGDHFIEKLCSASSGIHGAPICAPKNELQRGGFPGKFQKRLKIGRVSEMYTFEKCPRLVGAGLFLTGNDSTLALLQAANLPPCKTPESVH